MTYGRLLEKRKNGVYYFRQVSTINGKQVARRFSLKTTDIVLARFLALQIKARIEMMDFNKIKKLRIEYDENGNLKSADVMNENDAKFLQDILKTQELHRAEAHKREIEKLKLQQKNVENELIEEAIQKEQRDYFNSEKGQLFQQLNSSLPSKFLTKLKDDYIRELVVTENTKYKYNLFISRLVEFANSLGIHDLSGLDRKFVYSYLLHLRKQENKEDGTIRNIFNTLSGFYNHLIQIGETEQPNPFVGHKLKVEKKESSREPFTNEELEVIFKIPELKSNRKLFFICLLLVTTGARPNEICQLWVDDIFEENGIYKIRITENKARDQSLKTKGSKREIYLNTIVEKFGFIEYWKTRKEGRLFDLTRPTKKNYSTFISEDFSKFLRNSGIKEKTLYCFRHTVINRLKQKLVAQSIYEDLVGHEGKSTSEKFYSRQHSAENLKGATEDILQYKETTIFK